MEKQIRKLIYGDTDIYKDFVPLEKHLAGWSSESPVFDETFATIQPKLIIEVGSWFGKSAIYMAKTLKRMGIEDFEIVCVDTWLGSVEHWQGDSSLKNSIVHGRPTFYNQFMSNVIHEGFTDYITPFPIDSLNAAEFFKRNNVQADVVYIDAGHEYLSVKMDLFSYSDIVRPGGYLIGDDWHYQPIKNAVADTFGDKIVEKGDKFVWIK